MPKGDGWIFNVLILAGLIIVFLAIGSFIPLFLVIFGILLLAMGIYIGLRQGKSPKKEEIPGSQEISIVDNLNSSVAPENPGNLIRQNEAPVIEAKAEENKEEKEDENQKEELEEELKTAGLNEEIGFETEEEIEEETESSARKINEMQGWENKTPGKDLAFIGVGILFLIISSLLSRVPYISTIFSYLGLLLTGIGLYLVLKRVVRAEQVIDNWSIMIEKGNGKAEEIFTLTEAFMLSSEAPSLKIHRKEMSPGLIRGILGTNRNFLVATDKNFRLNPYQIFINARDYGNNLDVSWYLTYRLPFWRAILRIIPGLGGASFVLESLDLFDRQDLTAYTTICHHSTMDAVVRIMMILDQDTSRIDRKSRGFLGIS